MRSESERNRSIEGRCARSQVRPLVEEMVIDHHANTGSRMLAYSIVGRCVRRSPVWVRKLVGRQNVGVSGDTLLAVQAAYRAHCARVEQRAAARFERARKLMGEADAVGQGMDP